MNLNAVRIPFWYFPKIVTPASLLGVGLSGYMYFHDVPSSTSGWSVALYVFGIAIACVAAIFSIVVGVAMNRRLGEIKFALVRFTEGDLGGRIRSACVVDDLSQISRAVNGLGEATGSLITELRDGSQALEREIKAFHEGFERIKNQAQRSREASGTVAAALEELSAGVKNIAGETTSISRLSADVHGTAQRLNLMSYRTSGVIANQYIEMRNTEKSITTTRESVAVLERLGQEISGMAAEIMDITKSTRLLALNASIEAVRAGESGRGFMVVAEEVKGLAEQSRTLAERIRGQVEAVSSGTQTLTANMHESEASIRSLQEGGFHSVVTVEFQSALSQESAERLEDSSQRISEIARTIDESHLVLGEIGQSSAELDMRARAVESALEGLGAGLGDLGRLSSSFRSSTDGLKVQVPFFAWSEDLSVGVPRMDDQHKVLLRLINRVADLSANEGGTGSIRLILGQLVEYTKYHFADEESVMEKFQFPGIAAHRKIHQTFVAEIASVLRHADDGTRIDADTLLPSLKDWLLKHINGTDKVYGRHVIDRQNASEAQG